MLYVLCRDIQPDHSQIVSFYASKDFFLSPLLNNYLSKYLEYVVQHMAHYPFQNPLGARDHMTVVF
jgi:hypothetical protein